LNFLLHAVTQQLDVKVVDLPLATGCWHLSQTRGIERWLSLLLAFLERAEAFALGAGMNGAGGQGIEAGALAEGSEAPVSGVSVSGEAGGCKV
jgi:hypothetical protein